MKYKEKYLYYYPGLRPPLKTSSSFSSLLGKAQTSLALRSLRSSILKEGNLHFRGVGVFVKLAKICQAPGDFTLGGSTYTMPFGVIKKGSFPQYAKDTTGNEQGEPTRFPALTRSGERIAQPTLRGVSATAVTGAINVSVEVTSPTFAPVLEFQVSTTSGFENAYTHKIVQVTEGTKTHKFELPAGTYYVRAKLYNCAGGSITAAPATATVTVE